MEEIKDKNKKVSYADYLTWNDDERWEVLEGEPVSMSPAPNTNHQRIILNLAVIFRKQFKGKTCEAFIAPFDVRLRHKNENNYEITNVVQPDITVVCDKKKIDDKGCIGSPDLVLEILSPFTRDKDLKRKFVLYQKYGIKEYWIVDPDKNTVAVYFLSQEGL
jgi:Uma2 family endonuclease